jgi:formylmethanofuran dehydrogenase subunit C
MTLQLSYRASTSVPVEVEGVTPDAVREKSLAEIERLEIFHGNVKTPLAEFFQVSGDPADGSMLWVGDLTGVHWVGAKMTSGEIRVEGNAGRHVGSEMSGGAIRVTGDAGDWLGGEMRGGLIRVRGQVGHQAGAAYRGSPRGMTGGTILVDGDAGNEIGHTMRRGLIAIGGSVGDLAGMNMLAGTVLAFGDSGIRHGAGMRRGTLGFLGQSAPPLLPTFRYACRFQPEAVRLLLRHLLRLSFAVPEELFAADLMLYNGDLIEGGRGEVWLRG